MFFKKPKRKLDPRVRFQHTSFTRKLDRAKGYQRHSRPIPEGFAAFLSRVGLDSLWSKIIVLVTIAILASAVYVPQLLFVTTVNVAGADDAHNAAIRGLVEQYFNRHKSLWPQRNLLLLRRKDLSQFILNADHSLARVAVIKKKPFHGLALIVEPKQEQYVVTAANGRYIIYDDGTVQGVLAPEQAPPSNLIQVIVAPTSAVQPNDQYLASGFAAALRTIVQNFSTQTGQTLVLIALPLPVLDFTPPPPTQSAPSIATATTPSIALVAPIPELRTLPLDPRDISLYTPKKQNGKDSAAQFRIIVDTQTDLTTVLSKVGMLLKKLPPESYNGLSYIDMRLPDRAYTCAVHAPCDK